MVNIFNHLYLFIQESLFNIYGSKILICYKYLILTTTKNSWNNNLIWSKASSRSKRKHHPPPTQCLCRRLLSTILTKTQINYQDNHRMMYTINRMSSRSSRDQKNRSQMRMIATRMIRYRMMTMMEFLIRINHLLVTLKSNKRR